MKNTIYVGGGFSQDQLLWIIPIICEKNKNTNINRIIFEEQLDYKILKNSTFQNYLKDFEIIYQKDLEIIKNKFLRYLRILLLNMFKIFHFTFFFNKKKILDEKNWYKSQFFHAFWDICLKNMDDGEIKPNFKNRFYSILLCFYYCNLSSVLIKNGVCEVFLGHTVYHSRVMLANFRLSQNIKIFTQAAFNIQKQNLNKDVPWHYISNKKLLLAKKKINNKNIENYFNKRKNGKGNYYDANFASVNSKKKIKIKNFNTIFLHVFKDSPFNVIDKKRIFLDYFEWFEKTLSIIKESKEIWFIRLHPSHKRWGEDQIKTIESILRKKFKNSELENVFICDKKISNYYLIKNSNKILTFSGSVQIEAACLGKKVITIMPNHRNLNIDYTITPKNISEYKKIILSDGDKFKRNIFLNKRQILLSKYLLFIRENIHYLKKDLNGLEILRNDTVRVRNKNFKMIFQKIDKNYSLFKKNAELLNRNNSHTISSKYINLFIY